MSVVLTNKSNLSPRPSITQSAPVRIPIDLAEPPPPQRPGSNIPILVDGPFEPKPRLERSLSRHIYSRSTSKVNLNEALQLRKTLEILSASVEEKEKELEEIKYNKQKQEELVKKLNTDLKGAHILIQTLQKENQVQGQHRDKLAAGGSVAIRQKKKNKSFKGTIRKHSSRKHGT